MTLKEVSKAARPHGLFVMGITANTDGTLVLLGANARLWPLFKDSPEYADDQPDPLDRWSKRIVGAIAERFGADALFPSDGPPYAPFIRWALDTGQFFQSPTGMLVHPVAGLMISIRAALRFDRDITFAREIAVAPCEGCVAKPCTTACPVGALSADTAYDVPACKTFLDTDEGTDCMFNGCKARRACPISVDFARDPEQSAFHMKSFKE
jgi:hypothetical protein